MRTAELRPTANIVQQNSFSVQPQPTAKENNTASGSNGAVRSRRDVNIVSLEDSKTAKALVEKSDSDMAIKYALALAEGEASTGNVERGFWDPLTISDIEPNSSFGIVWANFTAALKAEPFATFARENNIDTSRLCWDAERYPGQGTFLQTRVNGKVRYFDDDVPGWKRASAAITSAINLLGPRVIYTGKDSNVPAQLVGSFYGSFPAQDQRFSEIGKLLNTRSFSSLSDSKSPYHRNMIELQQQVIQAVATQPPSGAQPAETVAAQVMEADNEVARMSASALLLLRNEIRPADASPMAGYVITPPEHSTIGQTIKAFDKAFQADAFLDFAREKKLDLSTVCIDPRTGDLKVIDRPNRSIRTLARVNDQSGWAQVSSEIRALAKKLGEGTNEVVPYNPDGSISLRIVLSFYGEPSVNSTLPETLKRSSALYHKGFLTLNPDTSPTDERARAVRQEQLTVIQQIQNQAKTQPKTPALVANANTVTQIARTQFAAEPDLLSVVAQWMSDAVKRGSQNLDFDINQVSIVTPDPDNPGQFNHVPLITLALNRILGDSPQSLTDSKLFDTRPDRLAHTGTPRGIPLDVDMGAIDQALLELPLILNDQYTNATSDYWKQPAFTGPANAKPVYTGSHTDLVSSLLRNNLRMAGLKQPGLDDEQRKAVDMVINHIELSKSPWPTNEGVATFTFPTAEGKDVAPNILITRTLPAPSRSIFLLVEPSGKITPYNSMAALSATGHSSPVQVATHQVFDSQANILIARHLGDTLTSSTSSVDTGSALPSKTKLSEWWKKAGDAERFLMSELSLELASFTQRNKGRTYNTDIPSLSTYIQKQFDALPIDQKLTAYPAKDLEVVYVRPANTMTLDPQSVQYERTTMSLTDMLMNNLAGLPRGGVFEVYYKPENRRISELEGDGVLRDLFSTLDVGKNYPALLNRELLDDSAKKAERLSLFTQQVPVELKIKALELSVKGEAGLDTTGVRYIQEIFKPGSGARTVDEQEITIRPLAFNRKADGMIDVVEGAYLIEPKDTEAGPHILYRPLISHAPLLQFPTRQALLEAIQKPGKLQKELVAWMPDLACKIYSGNGFTHPNVVLFGLKIPFVADLAGSSTNKLTTDEPQAAKTLRQKLEAGQLIDYLYDDNAKNVMSLADNQSTSDAESRWATLKEGGFLLLNAVLPIMRGPVAGYIGLGLLLEGIREDLDVLSTSDSPDKAEAVGGLLLNLAMLLLRARARSLPGEPEPTTMVGRLEDRPPFDYRARTTTVESPNGESVRRLMVMKGTMKEMKPIQGNLFTFEDEYKNNTRLNINAHGRDLSFTQQYSGASSKIIYDGAEHTAQELFDHLLAKGVDPRKYANIRLLVCYSGNGGENSFAADFQKLVEKPVKAFVGTVTVTPSPELVNAEFEKSIENHGSAKGTKLVADTYADYDTVDIVKNRNDISLLKNPLEYFLFTYQPVKFPAA
ncbi:dermonecrotic toxin domain-containing protein [Pseudomonas yamanorum]|uniref:Dermonecrotic toxin N-terminal domain-containing protein n=1 Tax=Pseudomonas yamanorum TaxID=515393 RepID=A0A7Y8EDD5_9PSED|nr:DUF6543 domain-containing protein [Pseudomonas yamanorum]NWE12492.1 hypothetical protein [Pseudomonas yamanorum]